MRKIGRDVEADCRLGATYQKVGQYCHGSEMMTCIHACTSTRLASSLLSGAFLPSSPARLIHHCASAHVRDPHGTFEWSFYKPDMIITHAKVQSKGHSITCVPRRLDRLTSSGCTVDCPSSLVHPGWNSPWRSVIPRSPIETDRLLRDRVEEIWGDGE